MKLAMLIILVCLGLWSCGISENDYLTEKGYEKLLQQDNVALSSTHRGDSTTVFKIHEDHGFAEKSYYLLKADNSNKYYYTNKVAEYTGGLIWDGKIYQTCGVSIGPSHTGKFIEVEFYGENNLNRKYNYDTTNHRNLKIDHLAEEGVYLYDSIDFKKVGELKDYCGVNDFKNQGLYYLTYPGIFYQNAVDIDALLNKIRGANKE